MYKVNRKDGKVIVTDLNDQVVYAAAADSIVIYRKSDAIVAEKISGLTDEALLMALANAVKINL